MAVKKRVLTRNSHACAYLTGVADYFMLSCIVVTCQ